MIKITKDYLYKVWFDGEVELIQSDKSEEWLKDKYESVEFICHTSYLKELKTI